MKIRRLFFFILLLPAIAQAHGPTRQQVEESITINAPPDKTWAMVGDFGAIHIWHPAIQTADLKSESVRVLDLGDGNQLTEELKKLDNEKMLLKYKITDMTVLETFDFAGREVARKVLPIDTYSATLRVEPEGDGSKVTWKGKFYRAYLLNPPTPEGMSDQDAIDAITGVYKAGLENLKMLLEK